MALTAMLAGAALTSLPAAAASSERTAARSTPTVTVQVKILPQRIVEAPGRITFRPNTVKAGSVVTFEITNADPRDDHVFEINGRDTKFIPSGGHFVLKNVAFTKPGRYVGSSPDSNRGSGGYLYVTP
jgi:hypothetical protein